MSEQQRALCGLGEDCTSLDLLHGQTCSRTSVSFLSALLLSQLSAVLYDRQKRNKVGNLLGKMRDNGTIGIDGTRGRPRWVLS
ncbi:hypothetical protein [Arthrobacter psychrochitiniphilus]|uniref:hypothetical protein n=1 Tax=Arthrobacter psychrochitiniphilus TaxID=291045 RepID=UPI003F7C56AD